MYSQEVKDKLERQTSHRNSQEPVLRKALVNFEKTLGLFGDRIRNLIVFLHGSILQLQRKFFLSVSSQSIILKTSNVKYMVNSGQ